MELWIRSQDKMKLVKVNYCYIMDQQDHFTIIGETIDSGPIVGIYKTKERALEVLDEIQNLLKPPIIFQEHEGVITTNDNNPHFINPTYGEIKQLKTIVYEMPKD